PGLAVCLLRHVSLCVSGCPGYSLYCYSISPRSKSKGYADGRLDHGAAGKAVTKSPGRLLSPGQWQLAARCAVRVLEPWSRGLLCVRASTPGYPAEPKRGNGKRPGCKPVAAP